MRFKDVWAELKDVIYMSLVLLVFLVAFTITAGTIVVSSEDMRAEESYADFVSVGVNASLVNDGFFFSYPRRCYVNTSQGVIIDCKKIDLATVVKLQ